MYNLLYKVNFILWSFVLIFGFLLKFWEKETKMKFDVVQIKPDWPRSELADVFL